MSQMDIVSRIIKLTVNRWVHTSVQGEKNCHCRFTIQQNEQIAFSLQRWRNLENFDNRIQCGNHNAGMYLNYVYTVTVGGELVVS